MFADSSLVWVPDREVKFVPARVIRAFAPGEDGTVALLDDAGQSKLELLLPGSMTHLLFRMDEESLKPVVDMVEMKELNEASILHNLRLRFRQDDIYTSIGDVLIAINPFKLLPLYTPNVVDSYIRSAPTSNIPPHIYKTCDQAFKRLMEVKKNQACMVTGESGSGKTETTKVFLQYLAEVCSQWSTASEESSKISAALSDKILKSNPLLESFGNATTRKNANSSRFGKLIQVSIDPTTAEIVSAKTTTFLLEKSRLPDQSYGERNFHIFYQICAGARMHPEIKQKYEILEEEDYHYLQMTTKASKVSDLLDWEDLNKAIGILGFTSEDKDEVFRIVSGILHLGNVEFEQDVSVAHAESSKVSATTKISLEASQRLLGLVDLEKALCLKNVSAASERIFQHQSVEKARKSRDALAIFLYSSLFDFLAKRVNDSLIQSSKNQSSTSTQRTIGVLDIFGFEGFDGPNNSFEQLCINYCNEKLQHQFNEFVFSKEKSEYEKQGVKIPNVHLLLSQTQKDTVAVLDLFEKPRSGLFHLMDEESAVPGGSDTSLLKKMNHEHSGTNTNYQVGKKQMSDTAFIIKHYVGPVIYSVAGLLEKNDGGSISKDLQLLCSNSENVIIRTATPTSKSHLGTQFTAQLDKLVKSLEEMEPHFVRCIKPNVERKGGSFNPGMVLDQLRCAGILEVCRIRQLGFPIRRDFAEFALRYGKLLPITDKNAKPKPIDKLFITDLCNKLVKEKIISEPTTFACGTAKVFLKASALTQLERKLEAIRVKHVTKIQRRGRGWIARRKIKNIKQALKNVKQAAENSDLNGLKSNLLGDVINSKLLGGGKHLPIVQAGWSKVKILEEEKWGTNVISKAILTKDPHLIRSAIASTASVVRQDSAVVLEAKTLLNDLSEAEKTMGELEAQILSNEVNLESFARCLAISEKIVANPRNDRESEFVTSVEKARAKFNRLKEEEQNRALLQKGLNEKSQEVVNVAMAALAKIGVKEDDELMKQGSTFLNSASTNLDALTERQQALLVALQIACDTGNFGIIARSMVAVIAAGLEKHPAVAAAIDLEKTLRKEADDEQELNDAAALLQFKQAGGGSTITKNDLEHLEVVGKKVENQDLQKRAEKLVQDAQEIIDAQNALHAALAVGPSIDFDKLKQTLAKAYASGLKDGELLYRVQKMMRAKHRERRLNKKKVIIDVSGDSHVPEKFGKKASEFRSDMTLERSRGALLISECRSSPQYLMSNHYQLKRRLDGEPPKIKHNGGHVREESLLETVMNHQAEVVSKLILGYTGEKSASFPPTSARTLIDLGLNEAEVADEIYVQLVAHLTENFNTESATRAWQLICLCVSTFFPSNDLLLFLIRFLVDRSEGRTDAQLGAEDPERHPLATTLDNYTLEQRYALYALKRLLRDLASLSDTLPVNMPSLEEVQAFGERVPVVTNITYPDGSMLLEDVIVSPLMNMYDLTQLCLEKAGILQKELHPTYGIFVRPVDKATMAAIANLPTRGATSSGDAIIRERSGSSTTPRDRTDSEGIKKKSSKPRFRLSITAVFGFAKSEKTVPPSPLIPEIHEEQGVFASKPKKSLTIAPKKKATLTISVKRTEEEIDWDVPLIPTDYFGDVLLRYLRAGRGAPRLVFKKRVFIPEFEKAAEEVRGIEKTPEATTTQNSINQIELLQAIDDFSTGALPFDKEDEVADVVAARVALKFGNRLPANEPERLMAIGQVESLIPAPWKSKKTEMNWARILLERKGKVNGKEEPVLHAKILERCKARPLYGSQLFRVTKKGDPFPSLLAVNQQGFSLVSSRDHKTVADYEFKDLEEFKLGKQGTVCLQLKQLASDGKPVKPIIFDAQNNGREIVELAREYEQVAMEWNPSVDSAGKASKLMEAKDTEDEPVVIHQHNNPIFSSVTEEPQNSENESVPEESLRIRLERVGATSGDIAAVLRSNT